MSLGGAGAGALAPARARGHIHEVVAPLRPDEGAHRLGLGGEGFLSFSVATPTGEGVTTPMTFTRSRRCVMVENLNLF